MPLVAFNFEMNRILNYSILQFAITYQSGQQSPAICGVKQSELQGMAVSVVVFQPHYTSFHFHALRRIALVLYVVVVTFTNRVWDIEAVRLVFKSLRPLKISVLYFNRVDDGSSRCIDERYSGRPAVTAPSRFIRAGIRRLRILLRIRWVLRRIYHPENQRPVRTAFRSQRLFLNNHGARR